MGLDDRTTAVLVRNPPCTGEVCALGSAFRASTWNNDCGDICRQLVIGEGDNFTLNGVQTLACGGDVYNFTKSDSPTLEETEPWGWIAGTGVAALVAIVYFALFLVYRLVPHNVETEKTG